MNKDELSCCCRGRTGSLAPFFESRSNRNRAIANGLNSPTGLITLMRLNRRGTRELITRTIAEKQGDRVRFVRVAGSMKTLDRGVGDDSKLTCGTFFQAFGFFTVCTLRRSDSGQTFRPDQSISMSSLNLRSSRIGLRCRAEHRGRLIGCQQLVKPSMFGLSRWLLVGSQSDGRRCAALMWLRRGRTEN